jgi:hypothetical protein
MLDWPLRALLLVGLVTVPYLAVARATGLHRLLAFSVRRLPVGARPVLAAGACWLAGVVAVPLVGSTDAGFRLYIVGVVAYGGGLLAVTYAIGALNAVVASSRRREAGTLPDEEGSVTLHGVATPFEETTTGPITGADCLVCETRTQGRIRRFRARNEFWAPHESRVDSVPFVLEDDTGSVVVDPSGARVRLAEDAAHEDVPDGGETGGVLGRIRRVERRLDPGDEVIVTGRVTPPETTGDPGAATRGRLVVTDGPGPSFVADPSVGALASLRRAVRVGGTLGVTLAIGGFAAMALAAGLV